jgi:GAF domain-containing protein
MAGVREASMGQTIRFKRWRLLSEAVDMLGLANSTEAALEILRDRARELAQADGVNVVRREGDDAVFVGENSISPLWTIQRVALNGCVSGMAMIERQPIVIPDIRSDPRVPLNAYLSTFVSSMAAFPIGNGEPIAALGIYWAKTGSIEPDALALLETLTRSANSTLERLAVAAEMAASRRPGIG